MSDAENLEAAYAFVSSMVGRADDAANLMWHGWALREAFMAGAASLQAERDATLVRSATLEAALIHDKERWLEIAVAYRNLRAATTANAAISEINEVIRELPYPTTAGEASLHELGRPENTRSFWGDDPSGYCNGDLGPANIRRISVKELEVELRLACDQRDCAIGEIVDLQYRVASLEAALRDAPQLFKIALYGKIDDDGNIVPMPEENDDWSTRWIGGTQDYELARAVCAAAAALADAPEEKT